MDKKEIYKIWAPVQSVWSRWVIPVPFVNLDKYHENEQLQFMVSLDDYIVTDYATKLNNTAIIVDDIDTHSVSEGLALATMGFIPIPSFSTTPHQTGAKALVDNEFTELALIKATPIRQSIQLPDSAPPAFLLDSNRLNMKKAVISTYDNSYDKFEQDFPSADFFKRHSISNLLIKAAKLHRDLKPILYKFQKQGLTIYLAKTSDNIKKVRLVKLPFNKYTYF